MICIVEKHTWISISCATVQAFLILWAGENCGSQGTFLGGLTLKGIELLNERKLFKG